MKTIENVKKEIVDLRGVAKSSTEKEQKKICKRIELLYRVQLYLETNPTEQFIEKQRESLKHKVEVIMSGYGAWARNNPQESNVKNPKSKYNSYMGLRQIKEQLATVNYLL